MSQSAASSARRRLVRGEAWAVVSNPAPAHYPTKAKKKAETTKPKRRRSPATKATPKKAESMATHKKKSTHHKKRNPSTTAKRAHAKKPKRKKNPSGEMVWVPASMVASTSNPSKPKKRKSTHHKKKRNPGDPMHPESHLMRGAKAVLIGGAAAGAGLLGAWVINKIGPKTPMTAGIANAVTGVVVGGVAGAFDPAAGVIIAHNYTLASFQNFTLPQLAQVPVQAPAMTPKALVRGSANPVAVRALTARSMTGLEELNGYEPLQGVVADNMSGYESLQGVVADNMGAAEDVSALDDVSGYEALQGIVADNMGAAEDVSALDDVSGFDDVGDWDMGDEMMSGAEEYA